MNLLIKDWRLKYQCVNTLIRLMVKPKKIYNNNKAGEHRPLKRFNKSNPRMHRLPAKSNLSIGSY
jgi:hypothetical protein